MKTIARFTSHLLVIPALLVSCQKDTPEKEVLSAPKEPTREAAVAILTEFARHLEEGDYSSAAMLMSTPPGKSHEEKTEAMKGILEKKEISSAGVVILAEEGRWGTLAEIYSERGANWAERWQLNADDCWGLGFEPAETAFVWTGDSFEIFRCDDVGKLTGDTE